MKRIIAATLLALSVLALAGTAEAARVRVVHRGHRTTVTVHRGFPIHRAFPHVYIRAPRVAIRVTPRVFLPPIAFGAVVLSVPVAAEARVWRESEDLDGDDGWTELTMNVDHRGSKLLLEISEGPARVSFVEVVYENGDAQVVDFSDRPHSPGIYNLVELPEGRKVDHVRLIAKTEADSAEITLHLLT